MIHNIKYSVRLLLSFLIVEAFLLIFNFPLISHTMYYIQFYIIEIRITSFPGGTFEAFLELTRGLKRYGS